MVGWREKGYQINDIHDFSKYSYTFLVIEDLCRLCFTVQLVCLWIDIDNSKFQPCSVSHRGTVSRVPPDDPDQSE